MYVRVVQVEWREVLATRGRVHEAGLDWLDTHSVVSMNDAAESLGRGAYTMFERNWVKRFNQLSDLPGPDHDDGTRRQILTELRLATGEVNGFLEALSRLVHELPHTLDRPPRIPSDL
ncbi:hypothetical protein IDM40_20430 [Nocardiopsis sp. HNM0947]|uniref:Uncharacterized protein n=1 Tax=Nocardiopsis coralli TaxID=2772213 RepID=A0ABR9PBG0_9ACTN|nr:hypothetical protein [Nocardiopsis coralli]MBE3001040.1 hypothetical protein [Nocardiopsis coralli]